MRKHYKILMFAFTHLTSNKSNKKRRRRRQQQQTPTQNQKHTNKNQSTYFFQGQFQIWGRNYVANFLCKCLPICIMGPRVSLINSHKANMRLAFNQKKIFIIQTYNKRHESLNSDCSHYLNVKIYVLLSNYIISDVYIPSCD